MAAGAGAGTGRRHYVSASLSGGSCGSGHHRNGGERVIALASRAGPGDVASPQAAATAADARGQKETVDGLSAAAPGDSQRVRRLKDLVYLRELRGAMTSGEFALRLRGGGGAEPGRIAYRGLCMRLRAFEEQLQRQPLSFEVLPQDEACQVLEDLAAMRSKLEGSLENDTGSVVTQQPPSDNAGGAASSTWPWQKAELEQEPTKVDGPAATPADPAKFRMYLREDQTVDFDGALSEADKAVRFSRELWERLNGRGFGGEEAQDEEPAASNDTTGDPPPEPQCVAEKRRRLGAAQLLLADAEAAKSEAVELEMDAAGGSATTAAQIAHSRLSLRDCEDVLEERRLRALLASVDLLLERAAVALEADLKRASVADWDVSGRQLKLFVVEFSLLDKQALWYLKYVPEDAEACAVSGCADLAYVLAAEELSVLEESCIEFASRLGLEESVAGDPKGIETQMKGLLAQTSRTIRRAGAGAMFYVDGAKLLWQDLQYAGTLFSRAALSNYTLRAREVRAMQRTAKDLATLIPFLIILIIPLSPVGHVLVFSFIQKYFPEFFPSPFTERRQNVMKIYQEILPRVDQAKDRVT